MKEDELPIQLLYFKQMQTYKENSQLEMSSESLENACLHLKKTFLNCKIQREKLGINFMASNNRHKCYNKLKPKQKQKSPKNKKQKNHNKNKINRKQIKNILVILTTRCQQIANEEEESLGQKYFSKNIYQRIARDLLDDIDLKQDQKKSLQCNLLYNIIRYLKWNNLYQYFKKHRSKVKTLKIRTFQQYIIKGKLFENQQSGNTLHCFKITNQMIQQALVKLKNKQQLYNQLFYKKVYTKLLLQEKQSFISKMVVLIYKITLFIKFLQDYLRRQCKQPNQFIVNDYKRQFAKQIPDGQNMEQIQEIEITLKQDNKFTIFKYGQPSEDQNLRMKQLQSCFVSLNPKYIDNLLMAYEDDHSIKYADQDEQNWPINSLNLQPNFDIQKQNQSIIQQFQPQMQQDSFDFEEHFPQQSSFLICQESCSLFNQQLIQSNSSTKKYAIIQQQQKLGEKYLFGSTPKDIQERTKKICSQFI